MAHPTKNRPSLASEVTFCFLLVSFFCVAVTSMTTYTVQTKVLVDDRAWTQWQQKNYYKTQEDLKKYIRGVFRGVADIYKNINEKVTYNYEIVDIEFLPYYNVILQATPEAQVFATSIVPDISKYLKPSYKTKPYDIAVLFTGFDLYSALTNSVAGQANVGHVCQQDGVCAIELAGNERDVIVTAHEIGHILGINHDGYVDYLNGDATDCSQETGYLMSPMMNFKVWQHYHFSPCSVRLLAEKIDKLEKESNNCLKDGNPDNILKGELPGFSWTPDRICRKRFGSYSFFSRKEHVGYGDNMCTQIACVRRNGRIQRVQTPQGLKCGKSKQCIKGKCVVTSQGDPLMSDRCPYGERVKPESNPNGQCVTMPKNNLCDKYGDECCYSCNNDSPAKDMTADEACSARYGQHAVMHRGDYASYGDPLCVKFSCLTGMKGSEPIVESLSAPAGLSCGEQKRCNRRWCTANRMRGANIPKDCPYGDQPWVGSVGTTCKDAISKQNGCQGLEKTCCASCKGKN